MRCTAADLAKFLRLVADQIEAKGIDEEAVSMKLTHDMLRTSETQRYRDTGIRHLAVSFTLQGYSADDGKSEHLIVPVREGNPALRYPLKPVAISASDVRARIAELKAEREAGDGN